MIREQSAYRPPWWLRGGHLQTVLSSLRRVEPPFARRERLETPDNDFVDVDHFPLDPQRRADRVAVLSHGLEGHSRRPYMLGMVRALHRDGWDAVGRNFRGCSGEMNRQPGLYHAGQTEDLDLVVRWCAALGYVRIALIGFSMGANQVLKYLGEAPERVPSAVCGAVAASVPCDMEGTAEVLSLLSRRPYMAYFLRTLRAKIRLKQARFPELFDLGPLNRIRTFREFDDIYTAPLHGFASASDYWRKSASLPLLERIRVPALLLNAKDDPFLSPGCFPVRAVARNPFLKLETPAWGGHVGFLDPPGPTWAERRCVGFLGGLRPPGADEL